MTQAEKTHDFEKTLEELEAVVSQLDGEVKLEKALELFEHGVLLSKRCEEFLKGAEQKVEILKRLADGSIVTQKFDDGKSETISSVVTNYDVEEDEDDDEDEDEDEEDDDDDDEDDDDDDDEEDDDDDDLKYTSKSKVKANLPAKQAARSRKKESLEIGMQTESADSTNQLRIKIEES
ncbi:MAG: exodeoxyribonuclease VII small subunit [Candidatus Melainabacteria bacterium]|nr:exodeoxyribonuclease VII small subunit [Candidatus Melainabacteria bacterium]